MDADISHEEDKIVKENENFNRMRKEESNAPGNKTSGEKVRKSSTEFSDEDDPAGARVSNDSILPSSVYDQNEYAKESDCVALTEKNKPKTCTEISDEDEGEIMNSDDEEEEPPTEYCKDGYHPVALGDVYNDRYQVIRKLGWGRYSTVWLSWDLAEQRFVALKIIKSASDYTESALEEKNFLECIRYTDPSNCFRERVVQLFDSFQITGINGTHICLVLEVLGCSLLKILRRSTHVRLPVAKVKTVIRQVIEGLDYLHRQCLLIHADILPDNVAITVDETHVRKLAYKAIQLRNMNVRLPDSFVSSAEKQFESLKPSNKLKSENKEKKEPSEKSEQLLDPLETGGNSNREMIGNDYSICDEYAARENVSLASGESSSCASRGGPSLETIHSSNTFSSLERMFDRNLVTGSKKTSRLSVASDSSCNDEISKGDFVNQERPVKDLESTLFSIQAECQQESETVPSASSGELSNKFTEHRAGSSQEERDFSVKLVDLGCARWIGDPNKDDIQSEDYKCLETVIGADYGAPADIWSTACLAFELATGDPLFYFSSEYDYHTHIFRMVELLGDIPVHVALSGVKSLEFFDMAGVPNFVNVPEFYGVYDVLTEHFKWDPAEAQAFTDFLLPMLAYDPNERAKASDCLNHPWLKS